LVVNSKTPKQKVFNTHFCLWTVITYQMEEGISCSEATSDSRFDAFFRHIISLTTNMHYIVLFLKSTQQDHYPSEVHWSSAIHATKTMIFLLFNIIRGPAYWP